MFFHEKLFFNWLKYWMFLILKLMLSRLFPTFIKSYFPLRKVGMSVEKSTRCIMPANFFYFTTFRCSLYFPNKSVGFLIDFQNIFLFFLFYISLAYIDGKWSIYVYKKWRWNFFVHYGNIHAVKNEERWGFNTIYILFEFSIDFVLL